MSSFASKQRICHGGMTGVAQAREHFLTFEGTVYSRYLAATRDVHFTMHDRMQVTYFSFYDHDATQSECTHRLHAEGEGNMWRV